jgi:hypothetical protein
MTRTGRSQARRVRCPFRTVPGLAQEKYFEALAQAGESGRTLSYDEWTELLAAHDQYRAE